MHIIMPDGYFYQLHNFHFYLPFSKETLLNFFYEKFYPSIESYKKKIGRCLSGQETWNHQSWKERSSIGGNWENVAYPASLLWLPRGLFNEATFHIEESSFVITFKWTNDIEF